MSGEIQQLYDRQTNFVPEDHIFESQTLSTAVKKGGYTQKRSVFYYRSHLVFSLKALFFGYIAISAQQP